MPTFSRTTRRATLLVFLTMASLALAARVDAACNLIPGTAKTFDAILGATNRPFAGPGEPLEIRLRPCDTASTGFLPTGDEHVVTVVFKAPDGTNRVVALANDCLGVDTATCDGTPGVASAVCHTTPGLVTCDRRRPRRPAPALPVPGHRRRVRAGRATDARCRARR